MSALSVRVRGAGVLIGLTLLLTGCLKLDMALTISSEDTVDGDLVFAVNKEIVELTGQSVDDLVGDASVPDDVEGATQEPYEDERFVGTRVTFDDVALADLQDRADPDALSIERRDDTFVVSGVMDLTADDADIEGNPFEDQIAEAFDTAELRIAITFPGEVLETNGRVDGTTVTWEPAFGERTELTAVASAVEGAGAETGEGSEPTGESEPASDGNALLYVIAGLVIVGIVVGSVVMTRRRNVTSPPSPPGQRAAEPPSEGMPPVPPAPPSVDEPVDGAEDGGRPPG
jgi:hypothetical protein